jgi:predicted dienelactone hydrolase
VLYEWHDANRDRDVPAKVYYPTDINTPAPVIIFSHGLGGSREGYGYLGTYWASHGYISVHLQHKGSDTEVIRNAGGVANIRDAMRRAAADPRNALNRAKDVTCSIDTILGISAGAGSPLSGRADPEKIGIAGHSFGANTTMIIAGEMMLPSVARLTLADPRVKAAIPMSTPVPRKANLDATFGSVAVPCLHMTGTLDDSPIGDTTAAERRIPFDHIKLSDQYLITFEGGDHMVFSGRPGRQRPNEARFQDLIRAASTAFWDAYLRGSAEARAWLDGGAVAQALGHDGAFEQKHPG